jgi:hypothetical protein
MSLDRAVLSAKRFPDAASFLARNRNVLFEERREPWDGNCSGVSTWLETRGDWDDEERQRYDELLGARVTCALRMSGSGAAGWEEIERLAFALIEETDGAYVSLDEGEVLRHPAREADEKTMRLTAIEAAIAGTASAFEGVLSKATEGYVSGLREELRARMDRALAEAPASRRLEVAEMAAMTHMRTLFGVLHEPDWSDPLANALRGAHRALGDRALEHLRAFATADASIEAELAGNAFASANAPSRDAIVALLPEAHRGDVRANVILRSWDARLRRHAPDVTTTSIDSVLDVFDAVDRKIQALAAAANTTPPDKTALAALPRLFEDLGRRAEMNVWLGLGYLRTSTLFGIAKGKLDIAARIDPNTPGLEAAYAELRARKP